MKKLCTLLAALCLCATLPLWAQRIQQPLGRGVVAVQNGSTLFVSWRKLAQEPENARYNVYYRTAGGSLYTKLNATPLAVTNTTTTTSAIPVGSEIAVALVVNGVEGEKSAPFAFKSHSVRGTFLELNYENTIVPYEGYVTKFIWPADLNGDGEYDYVVDRISVNDGVSDKVQGYLADGTYLWTLDMGPNIRISRGQDDMVLAYDMNCDGRAEVVIKSSDGTRFWDSTNHTWGAYLMGKEDTDGDGIVDYTAQSVKNPPQYVTCVDGLTGCELSTIEMPMCSDGSNTYTRTNKSAYMNEEYSKYNGHMGIVYLDGVHPSVVEEYLVRDVGGTHHNYVTAWGYDFVAGKAAGWVQKYHWSRNDKRPWPAEFHHIRVGDVDLDGKDEMLEGGYAVDDNGTMLFSAGISHGDRFRMSDINPDRPGLETFAIQQYAPDMLGEIVYDAATGSPLIKHYLSAVGDVGRGECMDVNKSSKGYEFWSTMGTLYSCDGKVVSTSAPFPREGIWWDGELDREMLSSPDGNGFNAMVQKYDGTRLIEMAKLSGWSVMCEYGCRPAFFGDIMGDWRDEVVLRKGNTTSTSGIVGFSTDYATAYSLYCLQQEPAYRLQCTTRGYYQSPFPAYYLGYDMPSPPLPPCMVTDLVWKEGSAWDLSSATFTDFGRAAAAPFANGKSVLFGVDGKATSPITLEGTLEPSVVYAMPPKGMNYTWNGSGTLAGSMELWKSQNGTLTVNCPLSYSGKTVVSEGTLELNSSLAGPLELRAKGTLAGNGILKDTLIFEGALNYEGCRVKPGTDAAPYGTLTFSKDLMLNKKVYFETNLQTAAPAQCDLIKVQGNVTITAPCVFNFIPAESKPAAGEYAVMEWTGDFAGDTALFTVSGLVGLSCHLDVKGRQLVLTIDAQRKPAQDVVWTGAGSTAWDYQTENFSWQGVSTAFVAGDQIVFGDSALKSTVVMEEQLPTSGVLFENETKAYTLSGNGGFSGSGGLTKSGAGKLTLSTLNNSYTGVTALNGGVVTVASLADGGSPSSLGSAASAASNWLMGKSTLVVNNNNTATNRGLTLTDTATVSVPSGITSLKGIIQGTGTLVKAGSGQLNLTYGGTNPYTGGTILKAGILAMGSYNSSFGRTGGTLQLEGGTVQIFSNDATSQVPQFNYAVTLPAGKTVTLNAGRRCAISGSFSGGGTLNLYIPYVRCDISSNWSKFTGKLNVTGRDLRFAASLDMSHTALTLGDGVYMGHFASGSGSALSGSSKIGSLSSTYTTSTLVNGTYSIGYDSTSTTFAGNLNGVTVNKYGTGSWTLTGASSATINIYDGAVVAGNTTAAITTGTITVNSGATLTGGGIVKNVKVNKGGILATSVNNYTLTSMTLSGSCSMASGSLLQVKRRMARNDSWIVNGTLSMIAPTVKILVLSGTLQAGDSLQLFTGSGRVSLTGKAVYEPQVPGDGLEWDDSDLATLGVLRVVVAQGIGTVEADRQPVNVYTLDGRLLREHVQAGEATVGLERGVYLINGKKRVVK